MINILYLVNKDHVQRKMSRVRFHSVAEIGKLTNVKLVISGKGWPDYDNSISVSENIDIFQEKNNVTYDFIMCYKPEELIEFRSVKQSTIIRYNEMYDREKVYQEICDFKPSIIICHHQNDYEYYKNYFLDNKLLDYMPHFYHIPHCVDRTIFKDYGYKKKYDITFSGALGNSILGNHYPMRQRLLKIAMIFAKKYPQYKLKIHRHPGYDLPDAYTNKYAVELAKIYNESKICITCSGTPKTRFAKYVEIPASNSVIIGDIPHEDDDKDDFNDFMISIKETDTDQAIMDKLLYYLRNEDKLNQLKIKGYKWSQKYTQEYYSKRFLTILNTYLENNKNTDKSIDSTYSTNNNIGCLWIGKPLGLIEMASLKSFLKHGHTVDLYLYDKTLIDYKHDNLNILDANDILLEREIFTYENGSYSAFSNLFRFTLLYKKGGYWCDLDLINLKPIDFSTDYVFVTEPDPDYKKSVPTSCLIKMPKNTYIGKQMIELCRKYIQQVKSGELKWGLGPKVIKEIVEKYNLWNYTKSWKCVCSCHPNDCLSFVYDESLIKHRHLICRESDIPEEMYCVHLWNKVIGDHKLLKKIIGKNNFFTYLINLQ